MDQYTEVEEISWVARYKNAVLGFAFAPLFFFVGFMMLKHGEINHARTTFGLKAVIHEVEKLEDAEYGDVVHISDVIKSPERWLKDELTGVDVKALKLYRKVYTWQWVEKQKKKSKRRLSGGEKRETTYTYDTRWVSDFSLSSDRIKERDLVFDFHKFKYKEGHENPTSKTFHSHLITRDEITFGAYQLDKKIQNAVLNFELLPLQSDMFPVFPNATLDTISYSECPSEELAKKVFKNKSIGASYSRSKSTSSSIFLGKGKPDAPVVGDVRMEYWYIPDGVYSVVAQKIGNKLEAIDSDSMFIRSDLPCGGNIHVYDKHFALLFPGKQSVREMFKTTHKENDIRHIVLLRFGGLLFVVGGFLLFGNPLRLLFGWIPFIGVVWEKAVFKLMQVLGTFVALCISIFYFLKYNSVANLTIYDFYFGIAVLLFLLFVNRLSTTVSSGGEEVYREDF